MKNVTEMNLVELQKLVETKKQEKFQSVLDSIKELNLTDIEKKEFSKILVEQKLVIQVVKEYEFKGDTELETLLTSLKVKFEKSKYDYKIWISKFNCNMRITKLDSKGIFSGNRDKNEVINKGKDYDLKISINKYQSLESSNKVTSEIITKLFTK
jgi:uncharacterized protein YdiU (UPF0061 family)